MPRAIPDWWIQASWFVGGIFATGALWYYLSTNSSFGIGVAITGAFLSCGIAIALHRKRDAQVIAVTAREKAGSSLSAAPTKENIERVILNSDPRNDWSLHSDPTKTVCSYKQDVNLRLEMRNDESGVQCEDFREPWANKFPDRSARGYWCDLYYGSSHIGRYVLVAVDGARALLPLPRHGAPGKRPHHVLPLDYRIAEIHDALQTLDQYMRDAGLEVIEHAI